MKTLVTGLILSTIAGNAMASVVFQRVLLNAEFYSEGINVGDINRDGIPDIVAGPYWYPGPNFAPKTAFRTPRATPFPITGDSDCYAIFIHHFNGDAWPDILSFRQDGGAQAVWYENPKGVAGMWTERVVFSAVHNESPAFVDVDGDGKPELVTNSARFGGWVKPDWNAPDNAWTFQSVTTQAPTSWNWNQFTHGAGAGDVNGDGKSDILTAARQGAFLFLNQTAVSLTPVRAQLPRPSPQFLRWDALGRTLGSREAFPSIDVPWR